MALTDARDTDAPFRLAPAGDALDLDESAAMAAVDPDAASDDDVLDAPDEVAHGKGSKLVTPGITLGGYYGWHEYGIPEAYKTGVPVYAASIDEHGRRIETPRPANVVLNVSTRFPALNLAAVARATGGFFNTRIIHHVWLRMWSPRCTLLIFRSGHIVVTGSSRGERAGVAAAQIVAFLSRVLGLPMQPSGVSVRNIAGAVCIGESLDLAAVEAAFSISTIPSGSTFPGMQMQIASRRADVDADAPPAYHCALVFDTARAIFTGFSRPREWLDEALRMCRVLAPFTAPANPARRGTAGNRYTRGTLPRQRLVARVGEAAAAKILGRGVAAVTAAALAQRRRGARILVVPDDEIPILADPIIAAILARNMA